MEETGPILSESKAGFKQRNLVNHSYSIMLAENIGNSWKKIVFSYALCEE
jgi:hypothetical protein